MDLHSGSKTGHFIVTLIRLKSKLWLRTYQRAPLKYIFDGGEKSHLLTDIHIHTCILTKTLKQLIPVVYCSKNVSETILWMDGWMDGWIDR